MSATLTPAALADALAVPDLTRVEPGGPPHALPLLVAEAVTALTVAWGVTARVLHLSPIVSVDDNYDRLGYESAAVTRDARYTRYVSESCLLRSHTSAGIPYALRTLATEAAAPADLLLALPGVVYRRDSIDRLHSGTPHQLDLWRVSRSRRLDEHYLEDMLARLVQALLPGRQWRTTPAVHPYTTDGRQVDVLVDGEWIEIAECGLAASHVLRGAGLRGWTGLALGLGLDRVLMLRKGLPDIRLIRSIDPRVSNQLSDLTPYLPVSNRPPVRRDLSIALQPPVEEELLGDRVRDALGADAAAVETVELLAQTPYDEVPQVARDRIGLGPAQVNALVRIVLRPVDRTLTDAEANSLRDRVYAALHGGAVAQWALTG